MFSVAAEFLRSLSFIVQQLIIFIFVSHNSLKLLVLVLSCYQNVMEALALM